jgi:hypothetical protein
VVRLSVKDPLCWILPWQDLYGTMSTISFFLLLWLQAEGARCLGCKSLSIVSTQIKYGIVNCGEEGMESVFYLGEKFAFTL